MKLKNIIAVRDAAESLQDSHPELAFNLIEVAKNDRPSGPAISQLYASLKGKLGITDLVIIGNCQAEPLAALLRAKNPSIRIAKVITAHTYKHDPQLDALIRTVDHVITQPIADKFGNIATNTLKQEHPNKVTTYLNLHFNGFHSDWSYLNTPKGRLHGPMGEYHNVTIVEGFQQGLTQTETLTRLSSKEYNSARYQHAAEASLATLKEREADVDIKMTDVVEQDLAAKRCSFHTFNHPNKQLLNEEANRILEHLSIANMSKDTHGEILNFTVTRANPISTDAPTENIGYLVNISEDSFKRGKGNIPRADADLVAEFYRIYEQNKAVVMKFKALY